MRSLWLAMAAVMLVGAAPAGSQDDIEARRAAARVVLDPMLTASTDALFGELRAEVERRGLSDAERPAAEAAFDREAGVVAGEIRTRIVDVVARNVPLSEITRDNTRTSKGWNAAGLEIRNTLGDWGEQRGRELMNTALEAGCRSTPDPSPACVSILASLVSPAPVVIRPTPKDRNR